MGKRGQRTKEFPANKEPPFNPEGDYRCQRCRRWTYCLSGYRLGIAPTANDSVPVRLSVVFCWRCNKRLCYPCRVHPSHTCNSQEDYQDEAYEAEIRRLGEHRRQK